MRRRLLLVLFLALASGWSPAAAQAPPPGDSGEASATPGAAGLFGRVVLSASGEPVPGAEVLLWLRGVRTLTNGEGQFALEGLEPGPEILQVRFQDETTPPDTVVLVSGARLRAELAAPVADIRAMEELVVRVRRQHTLRERSFERFRREARTLGHRYLDRELLRQIDPPRLSWILPLLSLSDDPFDARMSLRRRGPSTIYGRRPGDPTGFGGQPAGFRCVPAVFVNDAFWGRVPDLGVVDSIEPERVAGIATYRSPFVPARYRDRAGECGVLLIWTRWEDVGDPADGAAAAP